VFIKALRGADAGVGSAEVAVEVVGVVFIAGSCVGLVWGVGALGVAGFHMMVQFLSDNAGGEF
jgi:hypothetical protein